MARKDWSDFEDAACLYLYLKSGRKQLDDTNSEVIKLAEAIGRTPTAVSYKMANFRYVDPSSYGRGFKHISKTDWDVWNIYVNDIERLQLLYKFIISGHSSADAVLTEEKSIEDGNYYIPDSYGTVSLRVGEEKIRINALMLYKGRCSICGIDHPKLLVASHVVPWSADESVRGDPRNVILLCALHDRLFDAGLISVADDYTVLVSKALDEYNEAKAVAIAVSGKKLSVPARYPPKLEYLRYHRENVFKG